MTVRRVPEIFTCQVHEGQPARLMQRVQSNAGINLTQANVSSIACSVFDLDDTSAADTTPTLTIADVIFDTLQDDDGWTRDKIGFNFAWVCPYTSLHTAGQTYQVEILLTLTTGEIVPMVFQVEVLDLYSLPTS